MIDDSLHYSVESIANGDIYGAWTQHYLTTKRFMAVIYRAELFLRYRRSRSIRVREV